MRIMETEDIEFFFHEKGQKPRVIASKRGDTLRGTLLANGALAEGEVATRLCGRVRRRPERGSTGRGWVDEHAACHRYQPDHRGPQIARRHVHCHRCRHIAVEVHFGDKTKRHRFSPATTMKVVTAWALKKLPKLLPSSASEYVLQVCDTTKQSRADEHLGEVVKRGESICFNLVKEVTPQG